MYYLYLLYYLTIELILSSVISYSNKTSCSDHIFFGLFSDGGNFVTGNWYQFSGTIVKRSYNLFCDSCFGANAVEQSS